MPSSPLDRPIHLAVDLTDAGARPGAWRTLGSEARRQFDPQRLVDLVATAQRGTLDFVVFDDPGGGPARRPRTGPGRGGRPAPGPRG